MNVIITGASSGLGKRFAEKFRALGATVINISKNCDLNEENSYECDISDSKRLEEVFANIAAKYGKIDVLVNNAGYGMFAVTEYVTEERAKNMFNVNFFGAVMCTKYCLPLMEEGAKIFNICSNCATFALPYRSFYCSSKAALQSWSLALSGELRKSKIDVVAISPGAIKTNFNASREVHQTVGERYEEFEKSLSTLHRRKDCRMTQDVATKKIFKIMQKRRPKKYYTIGATTKIGQFFKNILGINIIQKLMEKIFI